MGTMRAGAIDRARNIVPVIAAESAAIHRGARLTDAAHRAMVDADLFRACGPARVGGDECDLREGSAIAEVLGRADISTGWLFVQANASAFNFGPRLDADTVQEIFPESSSVVAAGFPVGTPRADIVEGGYVVTGQWGFASGCLHSSWFDARAFVYDNGERVSERTGLFSTMSCLVPRDAVTITNTWDVAGMRGTGSQTYSVTNAFVPERRVLPMWEMAPPRAGPSFRVPAITYAHVQFASLALGGASAALDTFIGLATGKTAAVSRTPMREMATTHQTVAKARSQLRAAHAYQAWVIDLLLDAAASHDGVTVAERAEARIAVTSAMEAALDVVDVLYRIAGTSGIFQTSPLHRYFQDLHVMGQQLFARPSHYENVGRYLLGLDYDRSLF